MVTEATRAGATQPLHAKFCRDLSACVPRYTEERPNAAVKELLTEEPTLSRDKARETVLSEEKWKKMYNYTLRIREAREMCCRLYGKVKADDEKFRLFVSMEQRSYLNYILKPIPGVRRGTEYEVDNFLKHLEKGCYQDPLPVKKMSYPARQSEKQNNTVSHPNLCRKRGASGGEASNKVVKNKVGEHAAKMGSASSRSCWHHCFW
jgi:hypothetical protein